MSDDKMRSEFVETIERCGDAEKFVGNSQLKQGCLVYFIHGYQAALEHKPEVSQPMADSRIKEIFDGIDFSTMVTADDIFYLIARGVENEILSPPDYEALRQRVAELELLQKGAYDTLAANSIENVRLQSELTQEIEDSKEIQKVRDTYSAECVRLQSECDSLRKQYESAKDQFVAEICRVRKEDE